MNRKDNASMKTIYRKYLLKYFVNAQPLSLLTVILSYEQLAEDVKETAKYRI